MANTDTFNSKLPTRLCYGVIIAVLLTVVFCRPSWHPSVRRRDPSQPVQLQQGEAQRSLAEPGTIDSGTYFEPPIVMDGVLRKVDDDNRLDTILPPIYGASHASNLLELPDGSLLLVWFSNGQEGGDGVGIVSSKLPAGASAWTRPVMASSEAGRSAQNPVTFYEPSENVVRLLHTSQVAYFGQGTAEVRIVESHDLGATWGTPTLLFKSAGAFVKNQLLRSKDASEWLLPMYYTPTGFLGHDTQYSSMQRSSDGGRTWRESIMEGTLGKCVQPTVVRLRSGALRAWFRSRDADFIYVSDSLDDGLTWSRPMKTILPNNNSGIQATRLASGGVAMVFNNLQGPFARWPLTVALSMDEGKTWPYLRDLEPTDSKGTGHGVGALEDAEEQPEYSYPSIVQGKDGAIHISYTFRRQSIRYAKITEDWIRSGVTVGLYKGRHQSS
mmetsp:Transcript_193/g.653  ORF Transcript_193/g.653 Transcript_193/m.653 type:complete len:441 (+) Transcript_193:106-1428(+)